MAKYNSILTRATASATLGVGSIECPGSGMRRFKLYEYEVSTPTAAADGTIHLTLYYTSTASTGTSVTPSKINPADASAVHLAKREITTNGTTGDQVDSIALNRRGIYRWFALPESEIIVPATAAAGLIFLTPIVETAPAIHIVARTDE